MDRLVIVERARVEVGNAQRERALGRAYDLYLPRARAVARRYGARFVVARRAAPAPAWATPVTANATYELYRVADQGAP